MPLLVLGSKNHSSWSLRAWLFLRKVGFEFTERVIAFDAPGYQREIALLSPSGKVPLEHGGGWLSGEFSMADAMFAPVLFRFQTYDAELGPESRSYLEYALADPDVRDWAEAAPRGETCAPRGR
jgi:glutathione S-transferase